MLMNIDCSIVQSIKVKLTFDDNKTKEVEIAVGDLGYFEFNKNGARRVIEGKVVKIGVSNTTDAKSWFIVVDGSLDFSGQMERFSPTQILDCDIIQKHDDAYYVSTPNDRSRITDIRLFNGILQVSTDGGYSWVTPRALACECPNPCEGNPAPKPRRKKRKPVIIEEDPDDDYDDGYVDDEDGYDDGDDDDTYDPYDDDDGDDDDYGISPDSIQAEVY